MVHLEQIPRRIRGGITNKNTDFGALHRDMENLMIPLDRTHRVLLGTRIGHLEQVPGRIRGEITNKTLMRGLFEPFWDFG